MHGGMIAICSQNGPEQLLSERLRPEPKIDDRQEDGPEWGSHTGGASIHQPISDLDSEIGTGLVLDLFTAAQERSEP